ncbi:acylphosphatase [Desulfocarbo indianensis]|nr:acylphosphatase [Desulfocarbo indianensis]
MADQVRAELIIHGRVQGVFFRASTRDEAERLGLKGWVKNLPLMRVEAVLQGPEDRVKQAIQWCQQGPPGAKVTRVEVKWDAPRGDLTGFQIRY